ncbi:MAG: MFS transporter [Spirochaetaceae bacterium]|nr:MAG: MFS transporter [Spirochaetaceae bacterium]
MVRASMSSPESLSPANDAFRPAVPGLAAIVVMVFSIFFPRLLFSPLLVSIQLDLSLTAARATRIFTTIAVGYAVAMLASGFVSTRVRHRRIVALSAFGVGVGMQIAALAPTVGVLHAGALLVGASAGLYAPSGLSIVSEITPFARRGMGFAIHEIGPSVSFVLAPIVAAVLLPLVGWRGVVSATGVVSAAAGIGYFLRGSAGFVYGEAPHFENLKTIFRIARFWLIILFFVLAASAAIGMFAVLPTYLISFRGMDQQLANSLIGASRISGIAMIFLSGVLTDRFGFRRTVAGIFLLTGIFTILLTVADGPFLALAVLLQPAVISAFFPAAITAMLEIGPPQTRNVVVSLVIPLANLVGSGFYPALAGFAVDTGTIDRFFQGTGAALILAILLLPFFRSKVLRSPS